MGCEEKFDGHAGWLVKGRAPLHFLEHSARELWGVAVLAAILTPFFFHAATIRESMQKKLSSGQFALLIIKRTYWQTS
jgi:hypothetical protein